MELGPIPSDYDFTISHVSVRKSRPKFDDPLNTPPLHSDDQ